MSNWGHVGQAFLGPCFYQSGCVRSAQMVARSGQVAREEGWKAPHGGNGSLARHGTFGAFRQLAPQFAADQKKSAVSGQDTADFERSGRCLLRAAERLNDYWFGVARNIVQDVGERDAGVVDLDLAISSAVEVDVDRDEAATGTESRDGDVCGGDIVEKQNDPVTARNKVVDRVAVALANAAVVDLDEPELVATRTTGHGINTATADDRVVSGITRKTIVVVAAIEGVVAIAATEDVDAIAADDDVIAVAAENAVVVEAARNQIIAVAAVQGVVAVTAEQFVDASAAISDVGVDATEELVVAAVAKDSVVAATAENDVIEASAFDQVAILQCRRCS